MTVRHSVLLGAAIALLCSAPANAGPEEKAIAQRVAMQIKESGKLVRYKLGVTYQDGSAILQGSVADEAQAKAAAAIAKSVPGVRKVVNNLEFAKVVDEPAMIEDAGSQLASLEVAAEEPAEQLMPTPTPQAQPRTAQRPQRVARRGMPAAFAPSSLNGVRPANFSPVQQAQCATPGGYAGGSYGGSGGGLESPSMPGYAWPSYAAHPNYAALTYPKQYSPTAWPYIGPFYPYPQVPIGWRKVALEWDDGWWFIDFSHHQSN